MVARKAVSSYQKMKGKSDKTLDSTDTFFVGAAVPVENLIAFSLTCTELHFIWISHHHPKQYKEQ